MKFLIGVFLYWLFLTLQKISETIQQNSLFLRSSVIMRRLTSVSNVDLIKQKFINKGFLTYRILNSERYIGIVADLVGSAVNAA